MPIGADPVTHESVVRLARVLYESCGLEPVPVRKGSIQESTWKIFLLDMRPLEDSADGPLRPSDVRNVIRRMRDDNRRGAASWSLRPTSILRDPERFLDLVLESRRRLRKRPAPTVQAVCAGNANTLTDHDPALDLPGETSLRDLVQRQIAALRQADGQKSPLE